VVEQELSRSVEFRCPDVGDDEMDDAAVGRRNREQAAEVGDHRRFGTAGWLKMRR
jgi:hypothetical protein